MTESLYQITDLVHRYQGRTVLDIPRLSLEAGAITGLAGPNGSGKSTLLRLLALIERPWGGSLLFKGRPVNGAGPGLRRRISLVLQEPYLLHRSVEANVAYGLKVRGDTRDTTRRVSQALGWVGLDPDTFARRSWRELSGGEAQRVALAARLVLRPEVLLLDEPTTSLDAASAALIKDAAVRAHRGWGASLIVASHDLTWLHAVCGRVLGMQGGRLRESGPLNVLPGPWVPDDRPGLMRMELGDGQVLRVGAAGGASPETAALDPDAITLGLDPPEPDPGLNRLRGEVVSLTLQRESGRTLVQVAVDRLPLMVRISAEQVRDSGLHPGAVVWLSFPLDIRERA